MAYLASIEEANKINLGPGYIDQKKSAAFDYFNKGEGSIVMQQKMG